MDLIDKTSHFIGFDRLTTIAIANMAPSTYRKYSIDKKNGGTRIIHQPPAKTKALQYALIELLLRQLPISSIACGYIRGVSSPIRNVVERHAPYSFSVRVDFSDFFYSIQPQDLRSVLSSSRIVLSDEELVFADRTLFAAIHNELRLAIGAPSSPMISNVVMTGFDNELNARASRIDQDSVLSRYADDIVFSTNEKGKCQDFVNELTSQTTSWSNPRVSINPKKTIMMSRGTKRRILGVIATPEGKVSLGRWRKRYIRHLVHLRYLDKIDDVGKRKLRGLLAYTSDIEPKVINRLALKYGANIVEKACSGT